MMAVGNKIHTLKLSVSPGAWRLYSARKIDAKFKPFEQKILHRDQYTCQYCGFQAKFYQEIVNLDYNFANNRFSNLVTACCFCAQCFFIESVGVGGNGGGSLIYLPELTQAELNSLCHVLFCAIVNNTGYKNSSQNIYRSLKDRAKIIEKKFGEGTSDPTILGQLIIDSGIDSAKTMEPLFNNVRLLPSRAKFRKQIERWATFALEEMVKGGKEKPNE